MRCETCGADNAAESNACAFCGSHFPTARAPTAERAAIFARIRASAAYAGSRAPERVARLPKIQPLHKAAMLVFCGLFVGVCLFIFVMALGLGGVFGIFGARLGGAPGGAMGLIPLAMSIVPLGMAALGVVMFLAARKRMTELETAPLEALPVLIVDKRTQVSGGGERSAHTAYFVTCEREDGSRQEHQVWDGALYGKMSAHDSGVLYLRANCALDFDRVAP